MSTKVIRRLKGHWPALLVAAGLTLMALILKAPPARADEARDAAIVTAVIEGQIRPAHEAFRGRAVSLDEGLAAFCKAPDAAGLEALRATFADTVLAHAALEPMRYGPILKENRLERLAFWPDPRGLALKQVQKIVATSDAGATSTDGLKGKSVAVQGLTALEFLLHGPPAGDIVTAGAFPCAYGQAIGANIREIAGALATDWAPDGEATRLFTQPGEVNPLFLTHAEAAGEIVAAAASALELMADHKLGVLLGEPGGPAARPKLAPFQRAGLTGATMAAMLTSIRELVAAAGLKDRLDPAASYLDGQIHFELGHAASIAARLPANVEAIPETPEARDAARYVQAAARNLRREIGVDLSGALGLAQGFNSLDGD